MAAVIHLVLKYLPWETEERSAADHGEPAMVMRFLEVAKELGLKYDFSMTDGVRRAFPSMVETIESEAHDINDEVSDSILQFAAPLPGGGKPLRQWVTGLQSTLPNDAHFSLLIEPGAWGRQDAQLTVFRTLVSGLIQGGHAIRTRRELANES